MTTYTLEYWWRKPGEPLQHVVQTVEASDVDDAKRKANAMLGDVGAPTWGATLQEAAPARPYEPDSATRRKRKNTNAWKPRRYGGRA